MSAEGSATTPIDQLDVQLPAKESLDQDREWCFVRTDDGRRRIRFHDYHEIYSIPGLYEHLFYDLLECCSPQTVRVLLERELRAEGVDPAELTVLDLGAGNGMVGEELSDLGVGSIVGVDLIEEAAMAAERDRPGTYDDYHVVDLTDLSRAGRKALRAHDFNCLTSVAALGFGDIPPRAFAAAFDLVANGGWIAFNIKEDFLDDRDGTGFSRLIARLLDAGVLEQRAQRVYRHRLSTNGEPLNYVAIVAVKVSDVPTELLADPTGSRC
ncbi:MAG: hypothetical protein NVSMB25_24870 [Thermoleophilaceae bacterium]